MTKGIFNHSELPCVLAAIHACLTMDDALASCQPMYISGTLIQYIKQVRANAVKRMGFDIPGDWSGSVDVRGCIENEWEVRSRLEKGEVPEFFSVYALLNDGCQHALIDFKDRADALAVAKTLQPSGEFQ